MELNTLKAALRAELALVLSNTNSITYYGSRQIDWTIIGGRKSYSVHYTHPISGKPVVVRSNEHQEIISMLEVSMNNIYKRERYQQKNEAELQALRNAPVYTYNHATANAGQREGAAFFGIKDGDTLIS